MSRNDQDFVVRPRPVQEADASRVHAGRAPRPEGLDGRNLFLAGPRGAGKEELGRALAGRLGLACRVESGEDLPPSWDDSAVRVMAPAAFRRAGDLRAHGPVVYLMATAGLLAARLGLEDAAQRRALADELEADEPLYLSRAHFVIQAGLPVDQAVEEVLEKLALIGFGSAASSRCPGSAG